MRNLVEYIPRRLEDVLSREANPFKYYLEEQNRLFFSVKLY
jgi:hypothetical protein